MLRVRDTGPVGFGLAGPVFMNLHNRAQSHGHGTLVAAAEECDAFLQENPSVQYIDCVFADLCGVVRGKRIARAGLDGIFREGLQIPSTIYFLDARGDAIEALGPGLTDSGPTGTAWPVSGTITKVNWSQRPHGQVLMTLTAATGEPFFGEPRNVLRRVVERFAVLELAPVVGVQLEFHLTEREREKSGTPLPPSGTSDLSDVPSGISEAAAVQCLPATPPVPVSSSDQFRVDLEHAGDAPRAGDHAVFLRQVVRAVARQSGLDASFMAKPYLDRAGNGMRVQVGVSDDGGRCAFDDGTLEGSDLLRHAIGGLQAVMAESIALFAPNANSYRRFVSKSAVARNKRWSYDNPTTNIRVQGGAGRARRIEHRVAGADTNPYLAMAAVLAGIHHGITRQIDPGQPFEGNAASFVDQTMPFNFDAALVALENGSILREYMGPSYVDLYCAAKRTELERFRNVIPPHEYDWYM
jgi:glutamine synthetase